MDGARRDEKRVWGNIEEAFGVVEASTSADNGGTNRLIAISQLGRMKTGGRLLRNDEEKRAPFSCGWGTVAS